MFKQESHLEIGKKYKKGMCWGAWDGLHVGHLNLLSNAKDRCKKLYVGVSSDKYIKKIKGHKPIFNFSERCDALDKYASKYVDEMFIQDLDIATKEQRVKLFKPDVIFVGDDWKGKYWDGAELGVRVVYLPRTKGISSTLLRKRV